MIFFPKAKINLGLRITGKRSDGYHNIETLFYPVNLSDALEFVVVKESQKTDLLTVSGISAGGDPEENLVMKAVKKLREKHLIPFLRIHLHKAIPIGAGLGGGSSDAACFLKALNKCFQINYENEKIKKIALELGSDCPFFIDNIPSVASGRGEILSPVNPVLKGYYLVILNPGSGISTTEAYQNCRPEKHSDSFSNLIDHPVKEWKDLITNDFEDYAVRKLPLIGEIKKKLYNSGAIFSLMSGSGSSVFGIYLAKPVIPFSLKEYIIWEGSM